MTDKRGHLTKPPDFGIFKLIQYMLRKGAGTPAPIPAVGYDIC